ncbi:General substrate transporter [Kalmanozyma brasiliensis GHG001]|uniref:Major facilitator superfamily (MFS) profile domain-containing protein n=1 Tax=Kalmanozyma brasiliensis (strain GHG001) TaxID=1365824 RepID=V5ET22_KALBG|nr:General substrate transporter [Kalmanozyma brasiliensis GHG001]EST05114.1 General substrate transporter [Kalmanozyma brasiliensis GHG001]
MPAASTSGNEITNALAEHRLKLVGATGAAGLVQNARTFSIAVFASMGGLVYGYNQGIFGQVLTMTSFAKVSGVTGIENPTLSGLLTSILELGAWVGVLMNGYVSDAIGRKKCVLFAIVWFVVGVIIQANTHGGSYDYILAGRTITGVGIGSLSMIVPLYNAELAPPEIRGSLVALQQLAITFGIMISYWIAYGTQYIGGTGDGQSQAAWLVPITIQVLPALILGVGMLFVPESPRWLMNEGREQEALSTIAGLRRLPESDLLVQMEYLEVKAQKLFEDRVSQHDHPHLQDGSRASNFKLGLAGYKSLFTNPSNFKRTTVAVLVMLFQQWTGVNFILYYAPFIFQSIGLSSSKTISLLASGVVGIVMFLATIPAVLYVDKWGRKPTLIAGSIIMGICHFVVAIIIATCRDDWARGGSAAAGWVACTFIWIFAIAFGFSWGPCAWIIVAEVFPLGLRAKGVSIGASSNWLNNFAVAMSTPDFVKAAPYGAYIFLGLMCVIGTAYIFFLVPETKQKTLDELDVVFGDNSGRSQWESQQLLQAQRDVGLLRLAGIEDTKSGHQNVSDEGHFNEKEHDSGSETDVKKADGLAVHTA